MPRNQAWSHNKIEKSHHQIEKNHGRIEKNHRTIEKNNQVPPTTQLRMMGIGGTCSSLFARKYLQYEKGDQENPDAYSDNSKS